MLALSDIQAAQRRISDVIYHSPCPYSLSLSKLLRCQVFCKLDHLQMTGSFKERGARNKLMTLLPEERARGVVAASAGNHALALAYHGQLLQAPVTVVMPKWAPLVKVTNCRGFGARVILHGETYDQARTEALRRAKESSLTYIPGFDDLDIIAGAGTLGLEIVADVPDVDAIIVPVGGAGLIAGVAAAVKALRPQTQIIGVEPKHARTLHASLKAGQVTHVDTLPTLADGLAVAQIGELCFPIAQKLVDQVVLVGEVDIATAILRLLELEKMVVEGAGATPLAAIATYNLGLENKKVVLVLSGGNIDVTLISRIIERGLAAEGRLTRLTVRISERPGSLAQILALIAHAGGSIKEVSHDRNFGPLDVARVNVSCIVETRDFPHISELRQTLTQAGIDLLPETPPAL